LAANSATSEPAALNGGRSIPSAIQTGSGQSQRSRCQPGRADCGPGAEWPAQFPVDSGGQFIAQRRSS
jgi:hypothetical protein